MFIAAVTECQMQDVILSYIIAFDIWRCGRCFWEKPLKMWIFNFNNCTMFYVLVKLDLLDNPSCRV